MAPPARTSSFVAAAEQKHFDDAVLPLRPQPPVDHPLPSYDRSKFQPMSGQKRGTSAAELGGGPDDDEEEEEDEDDADDEAGDRKAKNPRKRNSTSTGRRKIEIAYIDDRSKRHVSFTKRKAGLMKKAFELSTLTGTECLILVVSETGLVYTYATPSLKPIVDLDQGRDFITSALKGDLGASKAAAGPSPLPPQVPPQNPAGRVAIDSAFGFSQGLYPASSGGSGTGGSTAASTSAQAGDIVLDPSLPMYPSSSYPLARASSNYSSAAFDTFPNAYAVPFPHPSPPSGLAFPLPSSSTSTPALGSTVPAPSAQPTPFQRASAEHQRAFATYHQRELLGAKRGARGFSEQAKNWRIPGAGRSEIGPGTTAEEQGRVELLAERKKALKIDAARALQDAKDKWTIPAFVNAHAVHVQSQAPVAPLRLDGQLERTLEGIELTMCLFGTACSELALERPDQLETGTHVFLERILPARGYSPKQLQEARTHLTLFFDFLDGHSLISSVMHNKLTAFDFRPKPHYGVDILAALTKWAATAKVRYEHRVAGCAVEGWFEVYRVRGNFVMLKGKDLKGDPNLNACLDPFKVRMPRSLTPLLRIDDSIFFELMQCSGRPYWVPFTSSGFQSTVLTDGTESDIDPSSYLAELARLEAMADRDEEQIKVCRETLEALTRTRDALALGELTEEDG